MPSMQMATHAIASLLSSYAIYTTIICKNMWPHWCLPCLRKAPYCLRKMWTNLLSLSYVENTLQKCGAFSFFSCHLLYSDMEILLVPSSTKTWNSYRFVDYYIVLTCDFSEVGCSFYMGMRASPLRQCAWVQKRKNFCQFIWAVPAPCAWRI